MNISNEFPPFSGNAPDSKKIISRKIAFDLPFVVMVEDNFGNGIIQSYYRGKRGFKPSNVEKVKPTTIDFTPAHNYANQTALDTPPPYICDTKYGIMRLAFLKVNNELIPEALHNYEYGGSIGKETNFTTVLIELDESRLNIKKEDFELVIQVAIDALNIFLLHYKIASNRFYLPPVTAGSICKFDCIDLFEDGSIAESLMIIRSYQTPFEKVVPTRLNSEIRRGVANNEAIELSSILYNEAVSRIEHHEYRMAVISAVILYESWIHPALVELYEDKGLTSSEIKDKFMSNEPKKKDRKNLGILEISENLLKDSIDFDFRKTIQYIDLKEQAILPRNSIIHKRKMDITLIQAKACLHAVMNAIAVITQRLIAFRVAHNISPQHIVIGYSDLNAR